MVRQRAKAEKKVEDTTWIPVAMTICRDIVDGGLRITTKHFALTLEEQGFGVLSLADSEQRLRKLTQRGWLHMGVSRAEDGSFIEYVWDIR